VSTSRVIVAALWVLEEKSFQSLLTVDMMVGLST